MDAVDGGWLVSLTVGRQRFALPLAAVERVLPMMAICPIAGAPPAVAGLIDLHGEPIPVFDLQRRLNGKSGEIRVDARLVIGRTPRRRFAVPADHVEGAVRVPSANLSSLKKLVPGAATLPDVASTVGGMIFIHDPETFLTAAEEKQLDAAMRGVRP